MMESIEVEQEITHGLSIGLTPWYLTLDDLERWSQNFGIKYLEYRERYRRDQTHYNAVFATCKTSLYVFRVSSYTVTWRVIFRTFSVVNPSVHAHCRSTSTPTSGANPPGGRLIVAPAQLRCANVGELTASLGGRCMACEIHLSIHVKRQSVAGARWSVRGSGVLAGVKRNIGRVQCTLHRQSPLSTKNNVSGMQPPPIWMHGAL